MARLHWLDSAGARFLDPEAVGDEWGRVLGSRSQLRVRHLPHRRPFTIGLVGL